MPKQYTYIYQNANSCEIPYFYVISPSLHEMCIVSGNKLCRMLNNNFPDFHEHECNSITSFDSMNITITVTIILFSCFTLIVFKQIDRYAKT